MVACAQLTITDAAFAALAESLSLQRLNMGHCAQPSITDAAFVALAQSSTLRYLDMTECCQPSVTDACKPAVEIRAVVTAQHDVISASLQSYCAGLFSEDYQGKV